MSLTKIANILDVNIKTVIRTLSSWQGNGFEILDDQRKRNSSPKKISSAEIDKITSDVTLQQQAPMTLVERSHDILQRFELTISPALLFNYYRQRGVRYRWVDTAVSAKIMGADRIQRAQMEFVRKIKELRQHKYVYYID